jgi:peptidoglycan/xylan/chitin deacetylase (PgdA/CDA1 family)
MRGRGKRVVFLLGAFSLCAIGWSRQAGLASAAAAASAPAQQRGPRESAFWERAKEEVYKSPEELLAQAAREKRRGLAYDRLARGNPKDKTVALTFDDGPHPQFTPQLLDILQRNNVRATFFVVGEMAEQYPDLIRHERSAGHVIGNHTYHHVNLTKIPVAEVLIEWDACQHVVEAVTGERMHFCRPPGGDYDDTVIRAAMALGLTTVLWTDDPGDYASPGDTVIRRRVLDRVSNGGIILLHDGIQQTIDVLPQIIQHLKGKGYRFVTVAEMEAQTRHR